MKERRVEKQDLAIEPRVSEGEAYLKLSNTKDGRSVVRCFTLNCVCFTLLFLKKETKKKKDK